MWLKMAWRRALGSGLLWVSLFSCASLFSNFTDARAKDGLPFYYNNEVVVTTDPSAYWTTIFKCNSTDDHCFLPLVEGYAIIEVLHFELPRLGQVSEIAFRLDIVKRPLVVSIVRRVTSEVNVTSNCELKSISIPFGVFVCNETQELMNRVLSSGTLGDFITISGILLTESTSVRVNRSEEIIKVRDLLVANNRTEDEAHCLEPGKFPSQQTFGGDFSNKRLYAPNGLASYECFDNLQKNYARQTSRVCVKGEWIGNVPICLPESGNHSVGRQCLASAIEEPRYFLHQDFSEVSSISVKFRVESEQTCETIRRPISIGGATSRAEEERIWHSSPKNQYHDGWCYLTFEPADGRQVYCNNCTILLNLTGVALADESCYFEITGINAEPERVEWMKNGCPPIDPYVGMPEEYANEAARNYSELNRRLLEKPCRDGYRHIQRQTSIKQCISKGASSEWAGNSPDCRPITCKHPPSVNDATWRYTGDSVFHEVQYVCRAPYWELKPGEGIARCNYASNEWEGVPTCKLVDSHVISCSKVRLSEVFRHKTLGGSLYRYVGEHDYCLMNETNKLQIPLKRLLQITEIAINIGATENVRDNVNVAVIRDPNVSVICTFKNTGRTTHSFICQEEGAAFNGAVGHTVEIFARGERPILDLSMQGAMVIYDSQSVLEKCLSPGMYENQQLSSGKKKFYAQGETVSYSCCNNKSCIDGTGELSQRTCEMGEWSGSSPRDCPTMNVKKYSEWIESGCPPIDPYFGMPEEYAGEAAMNPNELNERLKEKPCRDGYQNIREEASSIKQCVANGSHFQWKGESPKCILILCKQPPSVANADWRYASNSTFHEVLYTCRAPFKLEEGEETVKCNESSSEWEKVPSCAESSISWFTIIMIAIVLVLVIVAALLCFFRLRREKFSLSADYVLPANAATGNTSGNAQFGNETTYHFVASQNNPVHHDYSDLNYGYLPPKESVADERKNDPLYATLTQTCSATKN